jgi:hypothetical protein
MRFCPESCQSAFAADKAPLKDVRALAERATAH